MEEQDTLPVDTTCPWCHREVQPYDEFFDGSEFNCSSCGRRVVAVECLTEFVFDRVREPCCRGGEDGDDEV